MTTTTLTAQKRTVFGRKTKNLRRENIIPANIYSKGKDSTSVSINKDEFMSVYKRAGETGIVEITLEDGTKLPALISELATDPVNDEVLHIDFREVNLKEKITTKIPVELTGESPAEKSSLGTVVQLLQEVEVEALPGDLPESFIVDISNLSEVGMAIYISDLKVDKSKVEILAESEDLVAKVEPPTKEEELPVASVEEGALEQAVEEGTQDQVSTEKEEQKEN